MGKSGTKLTWFNIEQYEQHTSKEYSNEKVIEKYPSKIDIMILITF